MKKQNGEKALAAAAGISVPLLRYYRARGIGNDAEESAAAEALRQAEILRGAGFSASVFFAFLEENRRQGRKYPSRRNRKVKRTRSKIAGIG